MQDGSATTCETGEKSHEQERGECEDSDCVSLRIRLPNGQVSATRIQRTFLDT